MMEIRSYPFDRHAFTDKIKVPKGSEILSAVIEGGDILINFKCPLIHGNYTEFELVQYYNGQSFDEQQWTFLSSVVSTPHGIEVAGNIFYKKFES